MSASISFPLAHIAYHSCELFTEFGPCFCGGSQSEPCLSCQKANEIESTGLDWETEYQKWRKARASK